MSSRSIVRAIKEQARQTLAEQAGATSPTVTYSRPRRAFILGPGPIEHYVPNSNYRDLEPGERAIRRVCFNCGDNHAALLDAYSGHAQCRVCGQQWWINQRPSR